MSEMSHSGRGAVLGFHWHPRRKSKPLSPERRAELSATLKGKPLSADHRAKISAAAKEREAARKRASPAQANPTEGM